MAHYEALFDMTGNIRVGARRTADGAIVPADMRNADWRDFVAWEAAGRPEIWPPAPEATP